MARVAIENLGDQMDLLVDATHRITPGGRAVFEVSSTGHLNVMEVTPLEWSSSNAAQAKPITEAAKLIEKD